MRTANFGTDQRRWQAVLQREAGADGAFVYAVRTTGVYCRPSCAARRARRENVRFFDSPEAARRAGYRPCKRCRPQAPSAHAQHEAAVARACRLIDDSADVPALAALAAEAGLSAAHFHRVFKSLTGLTPRRYAAARRAHRLRERLTAGGRVTAAAQGAGFNSAGRLYAASRQALGMPPAKYRAGGAGSTIRYAIGRSTLGLVLVAATDVGVCAILLGDERAKLVEELKGRFHRARLVAGGRVYAATLSRAIALVERPGAGHNLPLDVQGTAFQQRVWDLLNAVPPGRTTTYTEVARQLGAPRAVRAVARACAANPLAVAVPCHRVVRRDGAQAGYRWGLARKRALLARERTASPSAAMAGGLSRPRSAQ